MAVHLLIDLWFLLLPSSLYYFSVSFHVAFFLFLSLVWLCRRFKEERSTENVESNDFLYYKLTFHTSLGLGLFYLLFSVFSYLWSNSDFLIELDLEIRTIFWFLFSCYMQFEFGRLSEKKIPVSLRVLFGLFLLISLYSLVLHLLSLQKNAVVGAHFWVLDFGSIFMALLLNYAGIFGTLKNREPDSLLQEPLLNRTCNSSNSNSNNTSSGSKNASLYTNAGLFSCLTFSWISPLLSLGYRKTLDPEDIPMVDERNSTNGVLPIFKTKLDSQTCANGRVTAFKVVKTMIFTCPLEIIVTAIYEIVTTLSSFVGPSLIDSFVQYLNGTKRFPKQGYLLVFAFIIAKIFECLSSTHRGFQLQQVGVRLQTALVGTIYQKGLTLSSQSRKSHTIGEINRMAILLVLYSVPLVQFYSNSN